MKQEEECSEGEREANCSYRSGVFPQIDYVGQREVHESLLLTTIVRARLIRIYRKVKVAVIPEIGGQLGLGMQAVVYIPSHIGTVILQQSHPRRL